MCLTRLLQTTFVTVLAIAPGAVALDGLVFECDFENGLAPPELSGAGQIVAPQGYSAYGLGGYFLHNDTGGPAGEFPPGGPGEATVLTLTGLPFHTHIEIQFDGAIIDSWDGTDPDWGDDFLNVAVDGHLVFGETIRNFPENPQWQSFAPAPEQVIVKSQALFGSGWPVDSLYAMGPSLGYIPHSGSELVISWWADGDGWQGGGDESWGIDNIKIVLLREVPIDIKPTSCPNPLNVKENGVLTVAILGSTDVDVSTIDPVSVRLEGVAPLRSSYEDVSTPVPASQGDCACTVEGRDGHIDLTLQFDAQEVVDALGPTSDGDIFSLTLVGRDIDGVALVGTDCVVITGAKEKKPPKALVGHWRLDETDGATAYDSSSNRNHGSLNGNPVWQPTGGVIDGALLFDGDGDYVSLPIGSLISQLTDCTIMAWVNWSDDTGSWQRVFDFGTGSGRPEFGEEDEDDYMFLCPGTPDGSINFAITTDGEAGESEIWGPPALPVAEWHHVAVVIDSASMTMHLHVNGYIVAINIPTATLRGT